MDKKALTRTIVLFIILINQILTAFGWSPLPFSDEEIEQGVSAVLTVIVAIWAWWRNNSFTEEAIEADKYLKTLKKSKKM